MGGRKVIFNVDTGIDDAIALIMALEFSDIDILGIATVAGNVDVDKTTKNTLRILDLLDRGDIPVYRGARGPLVKNLVTSEIIHGYDGLGDCSLPGPRSREKSVYAPRFITDTLEGEKDVTIVSTGPLTNIAISILYNPDIVNSIDKIIVMGGMYGLTSYSIGNVSPYAEYNFYVDPEAFHILYRSGVNIVAIGLDVTQNPESYLDRDLYNEIKEINSVKARIVSSITNNIIRTRGFFELHDPIAVCYLARPELFRFRDLYVSISLDNGSSRGYVYVFKSKPRNTGDFGLVSSAYWLDAKGFIEFLLDVLRA